LLESFKIVIGFLFLYYLGKSLNIIVLEWLHSTKHHIKDDSGTPNVDFVGVWLTCEHFWRTELDNPRISLHDLSLRVMLPRHIEVNNKDVVVTFPYQQIGWFYVSMDDLVRMEVLETF
jgi:hypothetical protein